MGSTVRWELGLVTMDSSGQGVGITSTCFTTSTLTATTAPCMFPWTGFLEPMLDAKRRCQRSGTARSLERRQTKLLSMLQALKLGRSSDRLKKKETNNKNTE